MKEGAEQSVQVVVMETMRTDLEVIASKEQRYSGIVQQQGDLQKKEGDVNSALKQTQLFLGSLKTDICRINNQIDETTNLRQKKISRRSLLVQLSGSSVRENLELLQELIGETDEAVTELGGKVIELKYNLKENEVQLEKKEVQLLEQESEKKALKEELEQLRVEKMSLQCTLEEDRKQFQHKMENLMLSHNYEMELEKMNLSHELRETKESYFYSMLFMLS